MRRSLYCARANRKGHSHNTNVSAMPFDCVWIRSLLATTCIAACTEAVDPSKLQSYSFNSFVNCYHLRQTSVHFNVLPIGCFYIRKCKQISLVLRLVENALDTRYTFVNLNSFIRDTRHDWKNVSILHVLHSCRSHKWYFVLIACTEWRRWNVLLFIIAKLLSVCLSNSEINFISAV